MKKGKKIYLQCGYEDLCKNKECLKCPRKQWKEINFSLAEEIAIEDFAVCDLSALNEEKPKELALLQLIMIKLMKKVYKEDPKPKKKYYTEINIKNGKKGK